MCSRSGRAGEQVGELAPCELGPDVGAVASFLEQVRVGVEGHARARVAEDAADLDDVEADVDDQVAGECVAQVVEAQPPMVAIEPSVDGGPTQHPLRDVVVQERCAMQGREHVVGAAGETRVAFVLPENRGELGEERDFADRGSRRRCDAVWWHSVPVYAPVTSSGWYRRGQAVKSRASSVRVRTRCSERSGRMRSLVALEPVEWMGRDVAAATREREDAAEGAEDPLDRPQRKPIGLQLARESDDIVGDWPLNVFDEGQAAAELPTLRALAAADVHNLVFQLGGDVRIIPATVQRVDG